MLTAEHWKTVFQAYAGHPVDALLLALQLTELKHSLKRGRKGVAEAIGGLIGQLKLSTYTRRFIR